ncbi:Putative alpha/beta hydrolase-3 [Septoria linicola]|uniref:Alpha/beta hydrolase-3 n=1 Tax=Septoria linicola TaxID=215465 RepID=A0A9Q9ARW0_9PEZI|nr:Putative alpha/beta hydrolase-3 [Septoria linicola]
MSSYTPPGRLGNTDLDLSSDPRTHPDLKKSLDAMGMGGNATQGFPVRTDLQVIHSALEQVESMIMGLYNAVDMSNPEDANEAEVTETVEEIDGPDGNKIKLYITKPKGATSKLPGVVYIHGGGMTINPTRNPVHDRWCKSLALQNQVVVMIDFRNAWTKEKHNPFPAGLNDCAAGVQWVAANRDSLGINNFIVQGESGGANLSLAVALKANREGWIHEIAGVYGYVPYISGTYGWSRERKLEHLPSQIENDEYFLNASMQAAMAYYYSPGQGELENPLAWPYHATEQDLKGLPPHAISVDELDGLRDEGVEYYRKLTRAGVKATCEVNLGVTHGAAVIFRNALPEVARKQIGLIAAFARGLQ